MDFEPGEIFADRYRIIRELGRGGMGSVYLVTDTVLNNEEVALKILKSELSRNEQHAKRFLREVQLTRKVTHPNIVRTYDVGSVEDGIFFTMECVTGVSLKDKLADGPLSVAETVQILIQVCDGLEAIHAAEIIHRDLKPGNVILTPDGIAKIADFGVARPETSDLTSYDEIIGSSHYMAPEIWSGKELTPAADIYALGVLAYEMLTGCVPFEAENPAEMMFKHLEATPVQPVELVSTIPAWLNNLVLALLEKDLNKRPCLASEVATFLKMDNEQNLYHKKMLPILF